ncbi:Allantoicase [Maublancomyces gigas]|uniref:Allantoicase n=1 Tax=Discina gigas TaxID=1032678 RepID=A0ABR3GSA4_9PEZI
MPGRIDVSKVQETFGSSGIDLVSAALGGQVLECSDEFFAAAENLINPAPPIHKPGVFVATGSWFDGWETRRHNKEKKDWVIIKLGVASGTVHGFEVDTAFFNGNHAPAVTVEGAFIKSGNPDASTAWDLILSKQECGPSQRHVWQLEKPTAKAYSHVRLNMFPDGGIARFRLYGNVVPIFPSNPEAIIDLAHVSSGGLAIACSDQHFGTKDNLLLPGRGKDMGDGWETKRSRQPGHMDWVIVKLGAPGYVEEIVVDTIHFRGNYPQAVEIYAMNAGSGHSVAADAKSWDKIVPTHPCEADKEHSFSVKLLQGVPRKIVTHVKMVIIPDGGVKRLRVYGRRVIDRRLSTSRESLNGRNGHYH